MLVAPLPGVAATKPGAAGRPLPGILPEVFDDDGDPVLEEQGALVLRRPWPSMLRTLYKEDERYRQTYFGRFDDRSYFGRFSEPAYYVGDVARWTTTAILDRGPGRRRDHGRGRAPAQRSRRVGHRRPSEGRRGRRDRSATRNGAKSCARSSR